MTADFQKDDLSLQLGALTLPVSDLQVQTEVPVLQKTLSDGSPHTELLGALPCRLTVTGKAIQPESGILLSALQSALRAHRAFAFDLAGMSFTGMQIVSASCKLKDRSRIAEYTVSLIGGIES